MTNDEWGITNGELAMMPCLSRSRRWPSAHLNDELAGQAMRYALGRDGYWLLDMEAGPAPRDMCYLPTQKYNPPDYRHTSRPVEGPYQWGYKCVPSIGGEVGKKD
jgi:hypothetical protein